MEELYNIKPKKKLYSNCPSTILLFLNPAPLSVFI